MSPKRSCRPREVFAAARNGRNLMAALAAVSLVFATAAADAAELIMFESDTCTWCERFDAEIGPIYPKTPESRCAPLRRVDLHAPRPDDLTGIKGVLFTPTFVLVEDGQEVGRLVGYPGEDFFWSLLAQHLRKLREPCSISRQ